MHIAVAAAQTYSCGAVDSMQLRSSLTKELVEIIRKISPDYHFTSGIVEVSRCRGCFIAPSRRN